MSMLLLPATLTSHEARDTQRLLLQALQRESDADVVVDAANLKHFDSAALAVLLECRRAAQGVGKGFAMRHVPAKLAALGKLYGVGELLLLNQPAEIAGASVTG